MQPTSSTARGAPARKGRFMFRAAAAALLATCAPAAATVTVSDDPVLFWNEVALAHIPGSAPVQTRAFAMLNIAMHDAVNAASGKPNHSYLSGISQSGGDTRAAASVAARTCSSRSTRPGPPSSTLRSPPAWHLSPTARRRASA